MLVTENGSFITIFVNLGFFWHCYKYKNMDKITQILENVVRCKYFEAGVHIKNPITNSSRWFRLDNSNITRPCCCGPYIDLRQDLKLTNIVIFVNISLSLVLEAKHERQFCHIYQYLLGIPSKNVQL